MELAVGFEPTWTFVSGLQNRCNQPLCDTSIDGGECRIRTYGTEDHPYNSLAGSRFQPLSQFSLLQTTNLNQGHSPSGAPKEVPLFIQVKEYPRFITSLRLARRSEKAISFVIELTATMQAFAFGF